MQTVSILRRNTRKYLDETDVDSYFYHNIFDTSRFQHRIARVSKGSNKTSTAKKVVPNLWFEDTVALYPLRRSESLQSRSQFFHRQFGRFFSNFLLRQVGVYKLPLPKTKIELESTKPKKISKLNTLEIKFYIQRDIFVHHSDLKTVHLAFFNQKNWATRYSNISYRHFQTQSTWKSSLLQEPIIRCEQVWYKWKQLRCVILIAITTIATLTLLGTCTV